MKAMVLGKFMPPHLGHLHLVEFARAYCEEVCVVVEKVPDEPIPSDLRWQWMKALCPDCTVIHLTDLNPQRPQEHPNFWKIWRDSLLKNLPWRPDAVVASETYGARLAQALGAEFLPADLDRNVVSVSGTQIREDPMTHWHQLPRIVRPYYVRRVRLLGPESTGKSQLAVQLAKRLNTVHVPEYAERWIRAHAGRFAPCDMQRFARGQVASIEALARTANRVLICDTDALTTALWSQLLYGEVPEPVRALADAQSWHLTLVCEADVPFAQDVHRVAPGTREPFANLLDEALVDTPEPVVRLKGSWAEREASAHAAIAALLKAG